MLFSFRIYLALSVLVLLLVVCSYQLSVSLMHGLLEDELESWQHREIGPTSYVDWKHKEHLVQLLAELSPFNGLALENSARFYLLGAEIAERTPSSALETTGHREHALQLIRASLEKQPIWSLAWMDLSFIKASLGQFDDEFQFAFNKALRTGGAERDILRGMSEMGFAYWRDLTPGNRQQFLLMLDTAVKREPLYVMNAAERHFRQYIPCLLIQQKQAVEKFCTKQ
jgi:hypothetical protein